MHRVPDGDLVPATSWKRSLSAETTSTFRPAARPRGEGPDQVVGLEARLLDDGEPHRAAERLHVGHLRDEVVGHRRSGSPCTRGPSRGGTSSRRSKQTAHGVGPVPPQELAQHRGEAELAFDGRPSGGRERADRVKGIGST